MSQAELRGLKVLPPHGVWVTEAISRAEPLLCNSKLAYAMSPCHVGDVTSCDVECVNERSQNMKSRQIIDTYLQVSVTIRFIRLTVLFVHVYKTTINEAHCLSSYRLHVLS